MDKNTVSRSTEQKLKLKSRADYISSQLLLTTDAAARASFESELAALRAMYKSIVPDAELQRRCQRLAELRSKINITTIDNRQQYHYRLKYHLKNERIAEDAPTDIVARRLGVAA